MTQDDLDALRFPIGRATRRPLLNQAERGELIERIAELPRLVRAAVAGLDDAALDTPYRPGGWTVRQVVHHVPDSHVNAYIRFRMAATESDPSIEPYDDRRVGAAGGLARTDRGLARAARRAARALDHMAAHARRRDLAARLRAPRVRPHHARPGAPALRVARSASLGPHPRRAGRTQLTRVAEALEDGFSEADLDGSCRTARSAAPRSPTRSASSCATS